MVKADRIKEISWRRNSRTSLASSPTMQGMFRHYKRPEEEEENSTLDANIGEILAATETDGLNRNERVHKESEPQSRPANQEFKGIVWLIVSRVFSYCRGKELFIFGLVVTVCLAALCIQLTLLRKSLHEARTEQMGGIINKFITENEHFKSEILDKIRDIDEGLKSSKFESLLLNINAFHEKLLKELKGRGDKLTNPDEALNSGEDNSKEYSVAGEEDDTGCENKGEKIRSWKEIVKNVIIGLLIFIVIFLSYCYYILKQEHNRSFSAKLYKKKY